MKLRLVLVGLVASLTAMVGLTAVAVAGTGGSDSATACVLNTKLLPQNEVRTTPNTSVASGHAQVKVRNDGTIEFKSFVLNPGGEVFNRAHIHGPAGSNANAGIVVDFIEGGIPVASVTGETITFMTEGRVRGTFDPMLLCAAPTQYYVNFHSTAEPSGAIRGQLG
jgi:hypothetical protein